MWGRCRSGCRIPWSPTHPCHSPPQTPPLSTVHQQSAFATMRTKRAVKLLLAVGTFLGATLVYLSRESSTITGKGQPGEEAVCSCSSQSNKETSLGLHDYHAAQIYSMFAQRSDHPRPLDTQTDTEMLSRYLSIKNRCPEDRIRTVWQLTKHTLISKRYKFSVCFAPKIASTFWKTVMHLLQNEDLNEDKFTTGLLNLNKDEIHRVKLPWLSLLRHSEDVFSFPRSSRAVVFTRNPYTRLFSAYIDKLFLPSFWKFVGIAIVHRLRAEPSPESLECGHDVTFEEFLRYVIHVEETGQGTASICDDHWASVTSLCNVCRMNYDYIGKQESFINDTAYIFQQLGLDKFLLSSLHSGTSVRNSINTTVWSFGWFIQNSSCVGKEEALGRVWYSLQAQGYLMAGTEAPWLGLDLKTTKMADIVQAFLSSYDKNKLTPEQTKKQRHQALVDAYSSVPLSVKRRIQKAFRYDFDLFGYDKEPAELFISG